MVTVAVAVIAAGDGMSHLAGQPRDRVASAQIVRPGPSPTATAPTSASPVPPAKPVLILQPTPTSTPRPVSAPAAASPTAISQPSTASAISPGGAAADGPMRCVPGGRDTGDRCPRPSEPLMCDFDGDTYGDLAVGAPGEDNGRGAVNLQYNRGGFLNIPAFLQVDRYAGDEGARFGTALACGDFNDDGVGDLAVGAPRTPWGGSVWIFLGKQGSGLDASHFVAFSQNNALMPGTPEGRFGHALAVGDFNRDGVDDLAVGDPTEPVPNTHFEQGMVVVVPGRAGGINFQGVQSLRGWHVHEVDAVRYFGWSLAAGPLVSGGGDDLAVGAPGVGWRDRDDSGDNAGRAYLFRDDGGLVPHQTIDAFTLASQGPGSLYNMPDGYDHLGWAVAMGDFNADRNLDLAIGIPGKTAASPCCTHGAGAVVIVPGTGQGVDVGAERYLVQDDVGDPSDGVDRYGWSLAAGNWNADAYDDLAVGAPLESVEASGVSRAGAVFVHYGAPGLAAGGLVIRQGSGTTPGSPEQEDWFGHSLASVRLSPVDVDFLVIGIPGERFAGDADCNRAGAVQLAMSWPGLGPITESSFLLHQDTGNPHNVADQRECGTVAPPLKMGSSDGAPPDPFGEFFGWATGS